MSWLAGLKGQKVDPNTLNPYHVAPVKTAKQKEIDNAEGWMALMAGFEQLMLGGR